MIPKDILHRDKGLSEWNIVSAYRGSISHGMYMPNKNDNSIDDKDIMSICIPPIDYYFGLKHYHNRGTIEIKQNEWDIVIYEFKKAIQLLKKGNPNILSILWLNEEDYIHQTESFITLIDNKSLFIGKHIYHSFIGYAKGQLYKMTHFKKYDGYMGNKRKRLVDKYGYDTKNASHLIRLLRMGIEFLNEGKLYIKRYDACELLEIKKGEWELKKVEEEAQRLFKIAELSYVHSKLPDNCDENGINKICIKILKDRFIKGE